MRSSLLLLTAAVTTVYLMSLILVHLYIHLSLDSTTGVQDSSLTAAEGSSHSITADELLLLRRRLDSDHRSGSSALNPVPEDANSNNSLETLDRCVESRRSSSSSSSPDEADKMHRRTASKRAERLRGHHPQRVEDHLRPSHSRCTDPPWRTTAERDSSSDDDDDHAFRPIGDEFLYSAYWDDRIASDPAIRIIALLKKPAKKSEVHLELFCHVPQSTPDSRKSFQTGGNSSAAAAAAAEAAVTVVSVAATFYEMCENHGKEFGGWILSCRLPADAVSLPPPPPPCSVYVSPKAAPPSRLNETGVVHLRVLRTRPLPPRAGEEERRDPSAAAAVDRFAVCVPPLFGRIGEKTFTDFVELTQILGADHLFFYVPHPVPPELRSAVDRYVRLGVVTAVPWTVPVPETGVWYSGQLLAINDCLYRSMHAFQFVAFNDLDEFVVPHRHSHWPEMIDALGAPTTTAAAAAEAGQEVQKATYCGYSFKSAFFDPMTQSSPGGAGHRVDYRLDSDLRTKSFSRIRNKLIVAPSLLFELGIHHISRPLDAEKCSVLKVDPQTAFVHHYRECTTSFDGKMNCRALCQDDSMSAFLSVLRS